MDRRGEEEMIKTYLSEVEIEKFDRYFYLGICFYILSAIFTSFSIMIAGVEIEANPITKYFYSLGISYGIIFMITCAIFLLVYWQFVKNKLNIVTRVDSEKIKKFPVYFRIVRLAMMFAAIFTLTFFFVVFVNDGISLLMILEVI